jgi:hypothetical protein
LTGSEVGAARWASRHTAGDAVFLTPPDFGLFRLVAERAIVVDFKAFPFQEPAMRAWRRRLIDCYGEPTGTGWRALEEMKLHHRRVDVSARLASTCRYGATHAVLPLETPTSLPVLFQNGEYRVVALP